MGPVKRKRGQTRAAPRARMYVCVWGGEGRKKKRRPAKRKRARPAFLFAKTDSPSRQTALGKARIARLLDQCSN